ncbi:glycosyltransferase family 39 protein [Candidatus Microgenomates bacterium]|nr:glycosyltransferase family 39 protein [Candidatus Microgenomates bacterium]
MVERYLVSPKLILLLVGAFLLRVILSSLGTLELDFNTFFAWSHQLTNNSFTNFYDSWSDYLPGYLYVLWLLAKINELAPFIPEVVLYKLPAILADIGTGIIIFCVVSRYKRSLAWLCAAFYLFNPAIIANSTLWGQVDSLTALAVITTLFYAQEKPVLSAIALAVGTLVKPQAGFITPIIGILWFKKYGFAKTLVNVFISASIFILGFIPFASDKNIPAFIFERLGVTANQYPYASVNAFNFWTLIGANWQGDEMMKYIGIIVITVIAIIIFVTWLRNFKIANKYLLAACLLLITFVFLTRMHERHLLPVLAPLLITAVEFPVLWIAYAVLSITYVLNLQYSFVWITSDFHQIFGQNVISLISFVNLAMAGLIIAVFLRPKKFQFVSFQLLVSRLSGTGFFKTENRLPAIRELVPDKLIKPILTCILLFALTSRLVGLWYPNTFYFDEVYHAWTAREMLHGNPAAWEWWNTPPEGFAYEWSHPPVAKLFMWGSMRIFGESPFAWRLPGAIIGTAIVYLIYLLGFQLFKNKTIALMSASIFSLDGLALVMSRIGMNDTYFLFFALLTLLFFLREKYFWSSVFLGLAAASKWTAFWLFPVFLIVMFLFGKKPRLSIFWFITIAPIVYLATYVPFLLTGHDFSKFIELQQQMWWYHTGLHATHAYSSSALSWPLMLRPVWFFVEYPSVGTTGPAGSGLISNIYSMGNPGVFWGGLVAMFVGVVRVVKGVKGARVILFIILAWGLMFLPWVFSPRIMFLYHYFPAVAFLSLAFGWYLAQQKKIFVIICYLLLVTCYLLFFPHWAGITVPKWWDNLYYAIPSWK